jgi:AcrR family transcriptional regulator
VTETRRTVTRSARLTGAERREQLLDVTKRIVGEDGMHAVSIDRVAREAGITRPVVYEHFTNLAGLLDALLTREAERAGRQLAEVVRLDPDGREPVEVLLAALAGYLRAVRAEPVTWQLVLTPREGAPESLRGRIEQARAGIIAQLALLLESTYARSGGATTPDPELTAHSMSALSDYWARLMLSEPERFTVERLLVHARWAISRF